MSFSCDCSLVLINILDFTWLIRICIKLTILNHEGYSSNLWIDILGICVEESIDWNGVLKVVKGFVKVVSEIECIS